MEVIRSTEAFYEAVAKAAPRLLVVDFFAEWCGPCKMIAPRYAELARKHHAIARFAKVDVDIAQDLAQDAGIRAMPTFQIYKRGERVFELKGGDMAKLEAEVLRWGADVSAALAAAEAPPLPQTALVHFDEGNLEKILSKLLQFDRELRDQSHPQALDAEAAAALDSAVQAMRSGAGWPVEQLALFGRLLRWPAAQLFPALDALRLAMLQPAAAAAVAAERADAAGGPAGGAAGEAVAGLAALVTARALAPDAGDVNHMLGLRCWCNLLAHAPRPAAAALAGEALNTALDAAALAECHAAGRTATRLALATLLLDAAAVQQRATPEEKTPLVCALQPLLSAPQPDGEVRARALLALGTLVHDDAPTARMCVDLDLAGAVAPLQHEPTATSRGRALAAKVLALLDSRAAAASEVAADAALYS